MAVLQNIRVKFGVVISIIIALALLSFIIDPSTLESAVNSMSSKYDVGQIAGKSISYTDFQEKVDELTKINELTTGTTSQNEQQVNAIRNAAWQEMIDNYLFIKNAKAAGITVGDDEMVDLTSGQRVSPIVAQSGIFTDDNGNFSREALVSFVQNLNQDESGNLKLYWNYLQNAIYKQQFYTKYSSLFVFSDFQNKLSKANAVAQNNTTMDVEYVLAPLTAQNDSTIKIAASEGKKYYREHKDFFRQKANRDIEYVVFEVVPSEEDFSATNEALSSVYEDFATTDNMKSFLLKNSDRPLSSYWYKKGELKNISEEIDDFAFNSNAKVSPILSNGKSFFAARVMDVASIADSVYVKHILLQGENAQNTADSLVNVIKKGASFSGLATAYSMDKGSAADGEFGNIGWMTQTYMIPGFESVITAEVGKPYVVSSQYGTHVVLVSKKTRPVLKKQVAILEKEVLASKTTFNGFYAQANKFATIAGGTYEGYKKAVDSTGLYSHVLNNVLQSTRSFGAIDQATEVSRWIFDAKAGKASNIITVNNNYFFVVALKAVHKEGYAPYEEVKDMISRTLYSELIAKESEKQVKETIAGMNSLDEIAKAFETSVSKQEGVSFSLMSTQMVEPQLLGAMYGSEVNKIGNPVAGSYGVYVYKVTARNTGAFYTEEDAKNYQAQMAQYKSQSILPVMMDLGDVKDNRARFY